MLMTAIVHHQECLGEHLHQDSNLRYSPFWVEINNIPFLEKVVVKYPWKAMSSTPESTGIPPNIVLFSKMEALQLKMQKLKDELKLSFK